LALTQFRRQDYDTAVQTLTPAGNADAPAPDVLSLLADAYEGANQIPEALKTLQRAVKLHPSEEQLYLQLAELCVTQGSYDLADDVLAAGLQKLGGSARLYAMRGVVFSQRGEFEQSEKAFELASRLNADNEMTAMGLTLTLEKDGRLDEAVEMLREQLRKNPRQPSLNYMFAQALLKQGAEPGQAAFEEALRSLQVSIESDPSKARPRFALGQLYLKKGETKTAIEHLERAVELDPSDSTAGYQLALAFLKAGRKDEAAVLMEKVRRLVNKDRQNEMVRSVHRLVRAESPGRP
jgi:tetratricopeptide (TPR) repeat protein